MYINSNCWISKSNFDYFVSVHKCQLDVHKL